MAELYDRIGTTYAATRRPDPRIAAAIRDALGDAQTVVNVGAGAGAYEPEDREVIAIEPATTMLAQRRPGSAPAIRGCAERLPLPADAVDAAMAVLSDHHWGDRAAGLRELRRVARRRVVLVNTDPALLHRFWLTSDYLPELLELVRPEYRRHGRWEQELRALLGRLDVRAVAIPHDCTDGFYQAWWRRPDAYLDPLVRDNISVFHKVPAAAVVRAVDRLRTDLASGAWERRHRELLARDELDLGLRVVVAELS